MLPHATVGASPHEGKGVSGSCPVTSGEHMRIFTLALIAALAIGSAADARGHSSGGRHYYGGGHHTSSHGGSYSGGHGSSHRGGHYNSPYGGHHYGRHK